MRLSQPGWTTLTVLCTASRNVKFQSYRDYKMLQLALALDLSKFCHITSALRQLHWLPVVKRIQFKILLLNFQPKSSYSLCSNNNTVLQYPQRKILATLDARFFVSAAPPLWNKLPAAITNAASPLDEFKNMIKTFLFNEIL